MNGEHFKRARVAAGFGQIELAVALELESGSMISMVERGVRSLSLNHAGPWLPGSWEFQLITWWGCAMTLVPPRPWLLSWIGWTRSVTFPVMRMILIMGCLRRAMYVEIHEVEAAAGAGRLIGWSSRFWAGWLFRGEWLVAHHINPDFWHGDQCFRGFDGADTAGRVFDPGGPLPPCPPEWAYLRPGE